MFVSIFLEILAPWPFKYLIDNVLEHTPIENDPIFSTIIRLAPKNSLGLIVIFLFFLINALISIFEYLQSSETKQLDRDLIYNFSRAAFENLERFAIGFYRNQQIGDYIYRLSYDVSSIGELIEDGLLPLVTSSLYLMITTVILFLINIKLTVLSLAVMPIHAIGITIINKRLAKASKVSETRSSTVFSFIQEALAQLKIIQAYQQEQSKLEDFSKKFQQSLVSDYKVNRLNFILSLVVGLIIAISYSFIIGYGIQAVSAKEITAGLLIVFIFYLDNLTNPLLSIISAITVVKESSVKIERLAEFFDESSHITDTGHEHSMPDTSIEFRNVSLVGEDGKYILHNVSFIIPKEKLTVIVGVSGSGKTSIISLIPRLINEPTSGKIFIGNRDIKEYSVKTLREHIGYVPQEIFLFNTTIKDVIAFGKKNATMQEVRHAAELAIASDFIQQKKQGYHAKVGEEGNYLSGGQRQRLMLARAYIKNADIMILDEVFSSQDVKTRFDMIANFRQFTKGKTIIIVTNILEIISEADYIIVINGGKVVNKGTHEEILKGDLLKQKNYYKLLLGSE